MISRRLRFRELKERGIVENRVTLGNWVKTLGFPHGQLTGPNSRTWGEDEVQAWLDRRPTARKVTPSSPGRRGRPGKAVSTTAAIAE
jgi:predicted DNA-binding transcriptional regulator AlpA